MLRVADSAGRFDPKSGDEILVCSVGGLATTLAWWHEACQPGYWQARRPDGIFLSDFEQGEIGPDLFRKACEFGLEGLVSKHRDRPYRGGRQKHCIKVRKHHTFERVKASFA